MDMRTNRRQFMKAAAATIATPYVLPGPVCGAGRACEGINLAWVGLGGQGSGNLASCAYGNNVVALCDVDLRPERTTRVGKKHVPFAEGMGEKYPGVKVYQDFRKNVDQRVPKTIPRVKSIFHDWLECIQTGEQPCSNFDYAAPLTEVILLGTLAIRTGKPVGWDAGALKVTNDNPVAASLVDVPACEGWRAEDLTPVAAGQYVRA